MSTSPPSSPTQSALARAQQREYQRSECLSSLTTTPAQSTSHQLQHARLEMFTPPTPAHATSSRALQNERGRLEMSSDSSCPFTPVPSTEMLFGDFRVLEQECKKLEKRAVRAEGKARKTEESLNRMTLMYCQAQSKTQNTEESFNQLVHMHHRALAHLENAEESIDILKHELGDACNGDWYFWDFVKELRCGICNKDLDGAYRIPASPAEIPSTALAYGSGLKRLYMSTWSTQP
ncbi:hypothetical protein ARMGADRAFT_1091270 [Armillaria gallica]|uniref:Uncharacterized protein n=1 Tax=Armillaria gallica TaxID=47427 RepID=A0A2H3CXL7_ARMGA|nr:hypothetical protein ARMGADRAFT_1091270 [Armillaria gallica]